MRTKKYSLVVTLALMSLAIPGPAQAAAVDYFLSFGDVPGETSGKHSEGILTFTVSAGVLTSAGLTLTGSDASGPYSIISSQGPDAAVSPSLYTVTLSDGHSDSLFLAFPLVSLVGYAGGPLCGEQSGSCGVAPLGGAAGFQLVSALFINGATTPTEVLISGTPTPEPSSLLMLGSGLLGFGALIRRHIRFGATN
jgi:hypothetical protein